MTPKINDGSNMTVAAPPQLYCVEEKCIVGLFPHLTDASIVGHSSAMVSNICVL